MLSSLAVLVLATATDPPTTQKINCPTGAAFSGDGRWFQDNNRNLYEVETGKPVVWEQPEGTPVTSKPWGGAIRFHASVAINFDGSIVTDARGYGVGELSQRVTYSEKGKGSLTEVGAPFGISFSNDGHWMATRAGRGTIVYDIKRGLFARHPVQTSNSTICQPLFTKDGRYCIASKWLRRGNKDNRPEDLVVMDINDNFKHVGSAPTDFGNNVSRTLSADGSSLLVYTHYLAMVLRLDANGKLTPKTSINFRDHEITASHVGFSRNKDKACLVVSAAHNGKERRRSLSLWPIDESDQNSQPRELVTDDESDNTRTAINADGTRLLYGRRYYNKDAKFGKDVYRWKWQLVKLDEGEVEIKDIAIQGEPVFHPAGKQFVAREAASDKSIKDATNLPLALFDADAGKVIRRFGEPQPSGC